MNQIEVGQQYRDNDTRTVFPFFTVIGIEGGYARCERGSGRTFRIKLSRLQQGGARGYTLLKGDAVNQYSHERSTTGCHRVRDAQPSA